MERPISTYRAIGWGLGIVVVDLTTKWLAQRFGDSDATGLIVPQRNPDLALGILTGGSSPAAIGLVAVLAVGFGTALVAMTVKQHVSPMALGVFAGGVFGNLIDRVATGAVHDWLHIAPVVLNIADVALVVGIGWFLAAVWRLTSTW